MKISPVSDKKDDRGRRRRTGSDTDTSSDEESILFDRPVTERRRHGPRGILMVPVMNIGKIPAAQ